ncbi:hypothetical protein LJK88_48780 [Paenibacillus sp. P26]|nr:hypothetical protein LJK88_48780 [Paenibacillus sp. P26]
MTGTGSPDGANRKVLVTIESAGITDRSSSRRKGSCFRRGASVICVMQSRPKRSWAERSRPSGWNPVSFASFATET